MHRKFRDVVPYLCLCRLALKEVSACMGTSFDVSGICRLQDTDLVVVWTRLALIAAI